MRILLWILLGLSACAPAAGAGGSQAGVIAEQTFNDLSGSAYTTDSLKSGSRLTNSGAFSEGGPGLGFSTFWFDTRGEGAGPVVPGGDADDYVGVNTFGGGGAPNVGPSGTPVGEAERNFEFNDGDGRLELTFDPVDVSGFEDRSLSLDYWINSTSYEADDAFTVTLSDGEESVNVLNFGESELEENASADDRGIGWRELRVELEPLFENGLGETLTLTVAVDTNSGAENVFVDNVRFAHGAQDESGGGEVVTAIHRIQGEGDSSPLVGQTVTVEGVVVGDFQDEADDGSDAGLEGGSDEDDGDLGGFYVQEEAGDADDDPATSEGLFVYAPDLDPTSVSVGDRVRVTGQVTEYETSNGSSLTQLADVTEVSVVGTAELPAPAEVTLPLASRGALERLEGMRVTLPQTLVISEYFNYDRFGEIVLSLPLLEGEDRPYTPTSFLNPDTQEAEIEEFEEAAALSRVTLDDGRASQNPFPARHPNGEPFGLDNLFRGGDTVANAVGVIDDTFGRYRLQPTGAADYTKTNPRPEAPEAVGGTLRVASFNLLNFFTTLSEAGEVCGANRDLGCRGADTEEEFGRQRAKIVEALLGLDADIVGLVELENTPGADPLSSLAAGLNARLGEDVYQAIDTGTLGTDAIRVGFLYKRDAVVPVGETAALSEPESVFIGPGTNRVPLAQSFVAHTGGALTVVVNHFKSKGCGGAEGANAAQGDGQGCYNARRVEAAEAVTAWLGTDPTGVGDADVLILGDLNAYDEEDPVDVLKEAGYTDLVESYGGEFAYSYVFDGLFGHLDYALASASLLPQVAGATEWRINADEPDIWDYDTSYNNPVYYQESPYRTSDHDPVLVGLELAPDPLVVLGALQRAVGEDRESLLLGLEGVQNALQENEPETALGELSAFRSQIEGEDLTPEESQRLLSLADALMNALR